ncbi:MAG: sensor domain-containing diguanylate cyclase [Coriobacteriia bacterium]|nr:sensor domain-containing diguanylate cyclase [Coriobacteriia bacterium]
MDSMDIHSGAPAGGVTRRLAIAVVGGGSRAASMLRLMNDLDNVDVLAVCSPFSTLPCMRLAADLGIYSTTDLTELFQVPGLDLIVDLSEDARARAQLESNRPDSVAIVSAAGSELVWDLLVAKKRGEEQEKLFVELQVAYDKIRSHERRLQSSKEALERANQELESRLAEIFFTHEFFKALTSYTSVSDVCSLIVDGCNGILGAEISCVYLFRRLDWTLHLKASQGRPESAFRSVVPVAETLLGRVFRDGPALMTDVDPGSEEAAWVLDPGNAVSQAAVPLRAGQNVFGVMIMSSATRRELTPAEFERLQVLGNQSSLSLQNALLHGELERLSVTDRLTEMYNHGYFQQRLEEEFKRARRFGHTLAVIMLDIDDFKIFNDTCGHIQGDDVLKRVAGVIGQNLREMDIAARYGGEEFVVLLPETDCQGAHAVAERIRREVEELHADESCAKSAGRTVSIGVAAFPLNAQSAIRLLDEADAAMYRAKRAGKNRVESATC